jgi:peptidoglycan/xylan/chitin deacetylase (PgdA/CDA1 family)
MGVPVMVKTFFSVLLFCVLIVSGLLFYIDYGPVSVIPILRYQHIAEGDPKATDYIHPTNFSSQMKFLIDNKFQVISLEEVARIYREHAEIPKRTVAITFDGGYDDFYEHAAGVLNKNKMPATVFLQSANIEKKGFLTKKQILEVAERGIVTFGSNGQTGRDLVRIGSSDAAGEIFSSKTSLEKDLEIPIQFFSYANGSVNAFIIGKAQESRYKGACALMPGQKYANNPYVMKRMPITPADNNPIFFKLKTWGNYIVFQEWRESRKKRK